MEFTNPIKPDKPIKFGIMSKILPSKGNLAWEYNPFRNYRLSEAKYYFRNKFFSKEELLEELGISDSKIEDLKDWSAFKKSKDHPNGIADYEEDPIFYDANLLIDFETDELNFSINHPVDILPLWSYDGSVNLIINDGKNTPRLINSRFSPLGRNKYLIVDRKSNNDTNIYDQGAQFLSDTSLYKTYVGIPKLEFLNVYLSGNLSVGNYHFYFKYVDADGNETDFVAESGMVSIFKGNTLSSITSGFRDENSLKSVKFLLSNIDPAYSYVKVYYTKSTSDIFENATIQAYRVELKFLVNNSLICSIYITGNEEKTEIPITDINPTYLVAQNVQTLAACQNMLFFGNIEKSNVEYVELSDLSLRFKASPDISKEYKPVPHDYNNVATGTYSDPKFIYNFVGYLKHEIYRFGIVYLMNDDTLSPVFNIRGLYFDKNQFSYNTYKVYKDDGVTRDKIIYNEDSGLIYKSESSEESESSESLENVFGVVRIDTDHPCEIDRIIGIKIDIDDRENLFKELRKHNIKGYFFVRLKRIPLRLCLALTLGVDGESNTPLLYTRSDISMSSSSKPKEENEFYITERFLTDKKILELNFEDRLFGVRKGGIYKYGAICPEYDINSPYLNTLFCGDEYVVQQASTSTPLDLDPTERRHFYINNFQYLEDKPSTFTNIVGVEDNTKLVEVGGSKFSARAGEAEEAFRYEYINSIIKSTDANNLLRGSYGPFLGFNGYKNPGTLVNIYLKDYLNMNKQDLFRIRSNDKSSYYAISERYSILDSPKSYLLYRGDTYICTFTHRVNRNFQDPSAPTNHLVVDENCWKENYKVEDGVVKKENFDKINLGDVNAVKLGMWVTFQLVSSINLNVRALDDSQVDEAALTGHPRTFFPHDGMDAEGSYKTPEALCYNKGFEKSLSERWNYEVPDVPALKNDFTNRISYSDIYVNDAFLNGFRVFLGTHYRDYPKTYGSITKLVELRGSLLCVFEHGVALIAVNERAIAGEGSGGNIYINTSNVLPENPKIISDTFGSLWKDSVIKTPRGVYGVDTVGKKIWRTNGEDFECISDFKVQEFLNQNISLTERELEPIIGVRNVKTHYNKFKNDVMFTFYDNLHGFEEKVWNLCFNESLSKWITFYSWVPSYSENIYNLYFSFDRNTSKWITKLGISKYGNDFADGVTLEDNVIKVSGLETRLQLSNRNLPTLKNGIKSLTKYDLVRDNYGNWKNFSIINKGTEEDPDYFLKFTGDYNEVTSEFYERDENGNIKKVQGRRVWLDREKQKNPDKVVLLLNIKAIVTLSATDEEGLKTLKESYINGFNNTMSIDAGYYLSTVAVIPEYNMQFLTTNFWKHGLAGIIDIADDIFPTYWYGKQHPFEFEFVVADNPNKHKIFDNLQIISNKAAPESFHYEIVGECYEFAKDKKNMYIRQEATKELYLFNGSDIVFNEDYKSLESDSDTPKEVTPTLYNKSTIFPLYYCRQDTINEIEDSYHLYGHQESYGNSDKNFSALAGAEIVHYKTLDEYRIWNHAKAIDIHDFEKGGRMRGNMQYKEDLWDIQINPINIVLKNENIASWLNIYGDSSKKLIPAECNLFTPPAEIYKKEDNDEKQITLPLDWERNIVQWNISDSINKEIKPKDKFIKIRVRYSGKDLAVISALKTLYSISYA